MDQSISPTATTICHLIAMPFPGRGHINPMMNLCKLLISRKPEIMITFVVTEEWLGYIGSDPKPDNICFRTIPNVIPPERLKAADFPGFYEAVMTTMETPFEQLLDQLEQEQPVSAIIGDIEVRWAIGLGNRRNIPVAAFWTMSISFFSMLYAFDQLSKQGHAPLDLPGPSSSKLADLKKVFDQNDQRVMQLALDCISRVPKSQYLLFTSIYELESQVTNTLRETLPFPVYPFGPSIPYLELNHKSPGGNNTDNNDPDYIQWLDSQPEDSVLYISLGSFLSVSSTQMDEIAVGLRNSGVRFVWVARGEASRLQEICGDTGLVLPWCDQLRVLCHPSVGGFWTHCGWNSTLEAVFAGVPMLTFPLFLDQDPNSNQIVEDWKIGWRVKREPGTENFLTKQEITQLVQSFMDLDSNEGKQMRSKARQVGDMCRKETEEGGSSVINLDAFIRDISLKHCQPKLTRACSENCIPDTDVVTSETATVMHIVAMPYPGRSHINSMMNLCKLLVSKTDDKLTLITFVVTEEWLLLIESEPKPDNILFASIPNVVPSELNRAADINGFIEAVLTKMESPFEQLLDRIQPPVTLIMSDSFLFWAVGVGNRRNIPVASCWPISTTMFSILQHWDVLVQNGHYPVDLLEMGNQYVDYIPGVSPTRLMDFPLYINGSDSRRLKLVCDIISWVPKAQHLIFNSIYELEHRTIDVLREKFSFPIYTLGPAIPCFKLGDNSSLSTSKNEPNYIQWLNCHPNKSVLYISFGSFHSVSGAQTDELAAGLKNSGVRFLWVMRGETSRLQEACGDKGVLVPWCDQLRVLSHPSVGGFLSHCGWTSIREGVFAGVPFLTFPLGMDQMTNSKLIVEDWQIGWRVRKEVVRVGNLVSRDAIKEHVMKFMDLESSEGKQMRRRVKELQEKCQHAITKDGSSEINIKSFIRDISHYCGHELTL